LLLVRVASPAISCHVRGPFVLRAGYPLTDALHH
jgi:hypothetical protein